MEMLSNGFVACHTVADDDAAPQESKSTPRSAPLHESNMSKLILLLAVLFCVGVAHGACRVHKTL